MANGETPHGLIDRLKSIARSRDRRIDRYVKQLRELVNTESQWSEKHDAVFDLMTKEIESDRRVRSRAFLGIAFLSFFSIVGTAFSCYVESEHVNRQRLLDAFTNAQNR